MVAFAEPHRPLRRAYAPQCVGSSSRANRLGHPLPRNDRNQQYSIIAITNGSAAIQERYAYTAYGAPTITDASGTPRTAEGNRYTYTGREWDEELSLYHYRARMYDPVAGRFCSRDPIGYEDGPNSYAVSFVPSKVDPTGLIGEECSRTLCRVRFFTSGEGFRPGSRSHTPRTESWDMNVQTAGVCPMVAGELQRLFDGTRGTRMSFALARIKSQLEASECERLEQNKNDLDCDCGTCYIEPRFDNVAAQYVQEKEITERVSFSFHWLYNDPTAEVFGNDPFEETGIPEISDQPFANSRGPCNVTIHGRFPYTVTKSTFTGRCIDNSPLNPDDIEFR